MVAKKINKEELHKAVRVAFSGDQKIYDLYDPNVSVTEEEDIVKDIVSKAYSFDNKVTYMNVYEKNELAGYFFFREKLLISFALNSKFRTRKYTHEFYSLIKKEIKGHFSCILWAKNVRAIKFLEKMGMEMYRNADIDGNQIIELVN